ncbi:MAG: hypothetical protein GXP48_02275 [Acidobacteria bacterium]|nr:hypothetical protein [Acidobacteriota bacterium]
MKGRVLGVVVIVVVVFLVAGAWAGIPGTDLWEPSLARTPGQNGSQWYATVWIHNPGTQAAQVTVSFLVRDHSNVSPMSQTVTVNPGETMKLGDVFQDLFGLSDAKGALRFQSDHKVVVSARSYNLTAAGLADSQGQFVAAMPSELAIGSGQKTSIPGITQPADGSFRSNFALVETAGGTANVQVTLYDRDGVPVATKMYTLSPYEPIQVSLHAFNSGATVDGGRMDVEVLSGTGKVLTFASMVGNGTVSQDPSTLEMEYELTQGSGSGLTQVAHDSTLAGDGTSSSPLGVANGGITAAKLADGSVSSAKIANGAVTTAKISGSGASSGQVLKFNGSSVGWAADAEGGLSLPYSGAVSSSGVAFSVKNTGSGFGIKGVTDGAMYGVYGYASAGGTGVRGYSSSGYGVTAGSSSGIPLFVQGGGSTLLQVQDGSSQNVFTVDSTGRVSAGTAHVSLPIAYAVIKQDGAVFKGTPNVSSTWNATYKRYEITIANVTYYYQQYVTEVTPTTASNTPRFATTGSVGGKLLVQIYDLSGNAVQTGFHVVVFKP